MESKLRQGAALGFLFVLGVLLVWSGVMGTTGTLFAAVICPAQLVIAKKEEPGAPIPPDQ